MRSTFFPHLVNGSFGDPALYVRVAHRRAALLFDCGDLHPLSARDILKIRAAFISHAHIDHLFGFDILLRLFLYRKNPFTLYGPPGIIQRIEHRLASYTWNLIEGYPLKIEVREWGPHGEGRRALFTAASGFTRSEDAPFTCPDGLLLENEHYRIRAVDLDHGGIISLAFSLEESLHVAIHKDALDHFGYRPGPWLTVFKDRIRAGDPLDTLIRVPLQNQGHLELPLGTLRERISHCEPGMKVAYVTDAAPHAENFSKIVALAEQAHLLAIEATFSHAEIERARERNHLTARIAGELARQSQVARLLVFHHSPRYQDHPEVLREEARTAFGGPTF